MDPVRADPLAVLRKRTSMKWRSYPEDVLPLFVAEMDYPLAAPVKSAMVRAIENSDLGYVAGPTALDAPFTRFAAARWGWMIDQGCVRTTTDVSVAAVEVLRQLIAPGDEVIIMPPVYPPFWDYVTEAGGTVREVPLVERVAVQASAGTRPAVASGPPFDAAQHWFIDLQGVEAALSDGARVILLCNPQNPLGLVHSTEMLARLAEVAARYDATVVSDEIHAPLVYDPSTFTPFLAASPAAAELGIALTSASKGWNLAGAKCAIMVAQSDRMLAHFDTMPAEVTQRTSQLGLHASIAAYSEGVPWLDAVIESLTRSRALLGELLAEHLPGVVYRPGEASYVAWLDFRALGWGDDPSIRALAEARVALTAGPDFGPPGRGFVRLNFACSPEVLTEAVRRLARAADTAAEVTA